MSFHRDDGPGVILPPLNDSYPKDIVGRWTTFAPELNTTRCSTPAETFRNEAS